MEVDWPTPLTPCFRTLTDGAADGDEEARRRLDLWRLSHPYVDGVAVRTIVWFMDPDHVVVALFAADKASMGDVFYDSVGTRADQTIDRFIQEKRNR